MASNMKAVKLRIKSVQSTMQITKAMELVASSKLRKAKERAEVCRPYFTELHETLKEIARENTDFSSVYAKESSNNKTCYVVIAGDRGLAGGYNANVVKLITESDDVAKEDVVIYAVGRKGIEILERKGYHIEVDASEIMENPTYPDAAALCKRVLDDFAEGKIGEIYLAYTHFKNTVSQEAQLIRMLPVEVSEPSEEKSSREILMNYEPNEQEALNQIIPKYVTSLFYGALVEAVASENGARMQAMDSATSNAEEMIEDLSLKYNRARQGSITQELTEIIAGANAIE